MTSNFFFLHNNKSRRLFVRRCYRSIDESPMIQQTRNVIRVGRLNAAEGAGERDGHQSTYAGLNWDIHSLIHIHVDVDVDGMARTDGRPSRPPQRNHVAHQLVNTLMNYRHSSHLQCQHCSRCHQCNSLPVCACLSTCVVSIMDMRHDALPGFFLSSPRY